LPATANEVTNNEASCSGIDGSSTAETALDTLESNKLKALCVALKDAYVHPVLKALGHGVINELKTLTRPVERWPNLAVLFSIEGTRFKMKQVSDYLDIKLNKYKWKKVQIHALVSLFLSLPYHFG
jgi:hypothetical protein